MSFLKLIAFLIAFIAQITFAGDIFKCTFSDGSITFADTPCVNPKEVIEIVDDSSHSPTYDPQNSDEYYLRSIEKNLSELTELQQKNSPSFIPIPNAPERPNPQVVPFTDGGFGTLTNSNSAIDERGNIVSVEIIGHDPYKEHRQKERDLNIAIEAERYRAVKQGTRASPVACIESKVELDELKANHSARPGTRSSLETRNYFYEIRRQGREHEKGLKSFVSKHCSR